MPIRRFRGIFFPCKSFSKENFGQWNFIICQCQEYQFRRKTTKTNS